MTASASLNVRTGMTDLNVGTIAVGIVGLLGIQNILLLAYLGFGFVWILAAGTLLVVLLAALLSDQKRRVNAGPSISGHCFLYCTLIGLTIYLLGGEGRFFYANTDWQVRGAVLRDLTNYPWPFVYTVSSGPDPSAMILRAPLGMYLLPAAVGKMLGEQVAELALLTQNALLLGAVLAAASQLFETRRERIVGAIIFFGFSGMDIVGQWLTGGRLDVHLEQWAALQFSAHLTQAYWVPQHALAGWIGALFYLLWIKRKISLAALAVCMPLTALLSPLALIGLVPFALHAGLTTLLKRDLRIADIILPVFACAIALPALLFLASGSGTVGGEITKPSPLLYYIFIAMEISLPLIALFRHGHAHRYGLTVSLIVATVLLLVPFGQIGTAIDFVMRVSIPSLAILAVLIAHMMAARPATERQRTAVALAAIAWAIGLATPVTETIRAIRFPASPRLLCSYFGVVPAGAATYVAPLSSLSPVIRPMNPVHITAHEPDHCWDGPWPAGERVGLFDQIPLEPAKTFDPKRP